MVELEDRVSQLESWKDGKGVIVVGAAGTFCSGSDLNAVRAISDPQVEQQGGTLAVSPCTRVFNSVPIYTVLPLETSLTVAPVALQDGMKMCMFMQNTLTRLLR